MKKILLLILAVVFAMSFVAQSRSDEKPRPVQETQKITYKPIHRRW